MSGNAASELFNVLVMTGTMLGTIYAGTLSLVLVMPALRMSLHHIKLGSGKVLAVWQGRRVSVVWCRWPVSLAVQGCWRDARQLAARIWIFRFFQLVAQLGWGALIWVLLTPGSLARWDVLFGTVAAAVCLLGSRTRNKRLFILSLFNPRPKGDPQFLDRAIPRNYSLIRFGQGDDKPIRDLAALEGPDALSAHNVAYMEGRFADALAILDRFASRVAAEHPAVAAKLRAQQATHVAEIALYAAEARQIPVTDAIARARSGMAGAPEVPAIGALIAVLAGDPETALPLARKARRSPSSRLDLADLLCTLAHVHGLLGDRAKAHDLLDRARGLVPAYGRPDHVARRLEGADARMVAAG